VNGDPIYQAWAPDEAIWSRWVKPVLFAHLSATAVQTADVSGMEPSGDLSSVPAADGATAIVVDLPGTQSVLAGLALASRGYRPVLLFNSVPHPAGAPQYAADMLTPGIDPGAYGVGPVVVVDMSTVVSLLIMGTQKLEELRLRADAPPAFLLDIRRRGKNAALMPRTFDNRSISLPTDFPSANFLMANGIKRAVLVQETFAPPETDLAHTLRRWQQAGMEILIASMTESSAPYPIDVPRPPWFRHLWYGLLARCGLRRNSLGGYGGFIPVPSSG
jgi:hypothetical protein